MYPIPKFEGPFSNVLTQFVKYKRSLGYDYGRTIVYRLNEMNRFFLNNGVKEMKITEHIFHKWIKIKNEEVRSNQGKRYFAIHGFAKFLIQNGYSDIYDGINPCIKNSSNFIPYIYTNNEILRIFKAADNLKTVNRTFDYDHHLLMPVLLRLLYSTGLRISEALHLRLSDIDFKRGNLMIKESKNHVSRMVSVSKTMKDVLWNYRETMFFVNENDYLFHGHNGKQYQYSTVNKVFHQIILHAGITPLASGKLPRIHDLRFVFSICAFEQMKQKGYDLYTTLPILCKYLGHKGVAETEYYIRLTKNSFSSITDAVDRYPFDILPCIDDE